MGPKTTEQPTQVGPLLLLTNADRHALAAAAEQVKPVHPEVAQQVSGAVQDAEALLGLLTTLHQALQASQPDIALAQLDAVLAPITALNDNEQRLRKGLDDLGGAWAGLTAIMPVDAIPLTLLTDVAQLHRLVEVAVELSDFANEVGLRASDRARQLERRSGAVQD